MSKKENSVGWKQCFRKIETWTESKGMRFIILLLAAILGLYIGPKISAYVTQALCLSSNLKGYLEPVAVSIFVLTLLWYFRTYDTRQKIYQDDLFKGLDNLASNNPVQVDVGVAMLIEISKKVPSFNKTIKVAFIRRLKSMPGEYKHKEGDFLSYAQHIMRWLIQHKKENKGISFNLHGLDLSYQEFTIGADGEKIIFKELLDYDSVDNHESLLKNLSLSYIDISGLNFTGVRVMHNDGHYIQFQDFVDDHDEMISYFQQNITKDCTVFRRSE